MKILQITPDFYPSLAGIPTYVLNLSNGLAERAHKINVLTINLRNAKKEELIGEGITIHRCPLNFKYHNGFLSVEFIKRLLSAKDYNLYHIHIPFALGLETAIAASRINHIPLVATHHGEGTKGDILFSMIAKSYSKLSRSISLRYVDRLIFLTQSYSDSLGLSTKTRERVRIVRTGADIHQFSPANDGSELRAKYGFNDSDRVLLFVGALGKYNRYKGVDYLLRAVHQVRNENSYVKLVIVGGGELVPELTQLAQELNLGPDVIFSGSVPHEQMPPYYAMCDVFVLSSISGPESCSMVLFEAMASGKPSIASDLPGVRDIVKSETTGLKVPPKDSEALAQAILRLVEDDNLRSEMSQNARREVEGLSWQKCAEEIEAVYREVIVS